MHNRKMISLKIIFFTIILLLATFSGCIEEEQKPEGAEELLTPDIQLDQPSILPDWKDGDYHDYYGTTQMLNDLNDKFPDLTNVFSIGKSVLGRDIWCIRITNENNREAKFSCLIDGCIHGCEWEAGEACLYLAEYLLINFDTNATVTNILNNTKVYIVPLVNPDGRQKDDRFNDNGIDLNRNFDIDFGRLKGHCIRIGKLFGRIKIPYLQFPRLGLWFTNCGRRPFSEPEVQTMRDFIRHLDNHDFSFYVNCHTATHNIISPWNAYKPPFKMTSSEKHVYDYAKEWVAENTEYENTPLSYYASGTATDWCFKEFRIPSFTFEILSQGYEPMAGGGKHDHLVHWMKTTLPVFMYMLVNIENFNDWKTPDIQPSLPEGVPPLPLK